MSALLALGLAHAARAGAIVTGLPGGTTGDACKDNTLPRTDDGSTTFVPLTFNFNFFGNMVTGLWVNNNGNVTFNGPRSSGYYMGEGGPPIFGVLGLPIIGPFFADVDTRGVGSSPVTYGSGMYNDGDGTGAHAAFCVDWVGVGYYHNAPLGDKLNSFQLLLVDRSGVNGRPNGDADIYFNYDQIAWDEGDNFPHCCDGLGVGTDPTAEAGYSDGVTPSGGGPGTYSLSGSRVPGAFRGTALPTSPDLPNPGGLVANSLPSSLPSGRYVFPVMNSTLPPGHDVSGTVEIMATGDAVPFASVQLCPHGSSFGCRIATADASGNYTFTDVTDGTWDLVAFPPGNSGLHSQPASTVTVLGGGVSGQILDMSGQPIPPGTSITTSFGTETSGVPAVYWNAPFTVVTPGCAGGTATATLVGSTGSPIVITVPDLVNEFTFTFPSLAPQHGDATITITTTGCATNLNFSFDIWIDPSGTVETTSGVPIVGATVTLSRADTGRGPYADVPDGNAIMSPGNRVNPDHTLGGGQFGWDVLAGYYKVSAKKTGCFAPGDPGQPSAESDVLPIPPPVTGLVLRLSCPAPDVPAVQGLQALIKGMGLDSVLSTDLVGMARAAGVSATAGDWVGSCGSLTELVQKAIAKTGKVAPKLTIAQAKQIVAAANALETEFGCLAPGSIAPAAEAAVLDLIGSVNNLGTTDVPWNELRTDGQSAGQQQASGGLDAACLTLHDLDQVAGKKLTAARYQALLPAIQTAQTAGGC